MEPTLSDTKPDGEEISAVTVEDLQRSTDQSLLVRLMGADLHDASANERLQRFVRRFSRRQLPKRVLVLPFYLNREVQEQLLETWFRKGHPEPRFAWEEELEKQAAAAFGRELDVILYCPARAMQLKEARTLVRLPGTGDTIVPLSAFAADLPRLQDLEQSYPRLWKLYVFTSATEPEVRAKLQTMCLKALPEGCVNALKI